MTKIKEEIKKIHDTLSLLSMTGSSTIRGTEGVWESAITIFNDLIAVFVEHSPMYPNTLKILYEELPKILKRYCLICTRSSPISLERQKIVDTSIRRYCDIVVMVATRENGFQLTREEEEDLQRMTFEISILRLGLWYPTPKNKGD